MSPVGFTNFFRDIDAYKYGCLIFEGIFKTSQIVAFLDLRDRFANFSFLTPYRSHISSAFTKTQKPQKFANPWFATKSKSIYELFLRRDIRQNKPSQLSSAHQLSKSEYKKLPIYELLNKLPVKASFKSSFAKINFLSKPTVKAI